MKQILKIGIVMVMFITSCDPDEERSVEKVSHYLPLQKGWYQVYDVTEIIYELGVPDTAEYELKTLVADSFYNGANALTYVIHRSKRRAGEVQWQNIDSWSVRLTNTEAIVQESNIPYVVLQFPATEGKEWNGNAYNNLVNPNTNEGLDVYTLTQVRKSFDVNEHRYENCLTVVQEDNQELIVYNDKRTEVYANGIGLVFKEKIQLEYCTDERAGCLGKQIVEEGIIYKQSIREYGKE